MTNNINLPNRREAIKDYLRSVFEDVRGMPVSITGSEHRIDRIDKVFSGNYGDWRNNYNAPEDCLDYEIHMQESHRGIKCLKEHFIKLLQILNEEILGNNLQVNILENGIGHTKQESRIYSFFIFIYYNRNIPEEQKEPIFKILNFIVSSLVSNEGFIISSHHEINKTKFFNDQQQERQRQAKERQKRNEERKQRSQTVKCFISRDALTGNNDHYVRDGFVCDDFIEVVQDEKPIKKRKISKELKRKREEEAKRETRHRPYNKRVLNDSDIESIKSNNSKKSAEIEFLQPPSPSNNSVILTQTIQNTIVIPAETASEVVNGLNIINAPIKRSASLLNALNDKTPEKSKDNYEALDSSLNRLNALCQSVQPPNDNKKNKSIFQKIFEKNN